MVNNDVEVRELFIVDDNADHRYLIRQIFLKYLPDYSTRFFEGGEHLCQYLTNQSDRGAEAQLPAAIILDLHMPYLNGIQILKLIKNQTDEKYLLWCSIPVIIMTSQGNDDQVLDCYQAGANAFVRKPEELHELKDILSTICKFWIGVNRTPKLKNVIVALSK